MGGARLFAPVQTGPGVHPASCTIGTRSFPGVKSGRGVTLTPHPLLVPWSRKGRAISLLPLWAVRPVQSLSACTSVHFTFYLFTPALALTSQLQIYRIRTEIYRGTCQRQRRSGIQSTRMFGVTHKMSSGKVLPSSTQYDYRVPTYATEPRNRQTHVHTPTNSVLHYF